MRGTLPCRRRTPSCVCARFMPACLLASTRTCRRWRLVPSLPHRTHPSIHAPFRHHFNKPPPPPPPVNYCTKHTRVQHCAVPDPSMHPLDLCGTAITSVLCHLPPRSPGAYACTLLSFSNRPPASRALRCLCFCCMLPLLHDTCYMLPLLHATDHIFTLHTLISQARAETRPIYTCFVDFKKPSTLSPAPSFGNASQKPALMAPCLPPSNPSTPQSPPAPSPLRALPIPSPATLA